MNNANVIVDDRAILAMFDELDEKRRAQAFRGTLQASANILVRQTQSNLRGILKSTRNKNRWNGKTLEQGMMKYLFKNNKGITVAIGGRDKRIDFRLKFFETGTVDRHTKGNKITGYYWSGGRKYAKRAGEGGNRGKIEAKYYFKSAKQQTDRQIFDGFDSTLSRYIQKINTKYANK